MLLKTAQLRLWAGGASANNKKSTQKALAAFSPAQQSILCWRIFIRHLSVGYDLTAKHCSFATKVFLKVISGWSK